MGISTDVPIERYGLIGDCGTAALVSDEGSIDWLCLPGFDADPVFGRLLDSGGGHCTVRAAMLRQTRRRYLPGTPALETTFRTETGVATLTDLFASVPAARKEAKLWPFRWLIRRVQGEEGRVGLDVEVAPRDPFGGGRWDLRPHGRALTARRGGRAILAACSAPFAVERDTASARIEIGAGDVAHLCLAYADRDVGILPSVGAAAERAFRDTVASWEEWSSEIPCAPEHRAAVERSALTLKLLTFAPSGGVVAAPTTSLPEAIGGERNWDYRHVWIRDASPSVIALLDRGHPEDARAYLFWIANATRLTRPGVDTLYALSGERAKRETEVPGLRGYAGSLPVRNGNAAAGQLQLDNWGYLADAAFVFAERTGELPWGLWASVRAFVDFAAANWRRPDHGIWEFRDRPRHFVHSKVMCWVALDRGLRLAGLLREDAPVAEWERVRDEIHASVLLHGIDADRGTFMRAFDDPVVDASLLELPIVGFLPGDDDRVLATIERVRTELGHDDLVMRYRADDGLSGGEGAFLPCSFWLAHALAYAGRRDEAAGVFERACGRANGLGLLPEEIDPVAGVFLGNFPQGLSHLALLAAAGGLEDQPSGA
ncbi:MAG TPA: glycoside hydrolase family 15 protein [Actinomycetota bacterium]